MGFRWAPSENAWQRQLNNAGIYAARRILAGLGVSNASQNVAPDSTA